MGDAEGTLVHSDEENFIVGFVKAHILRWLKSENQQLVRMGLSFIPGGNME